MKIIIPEEIKYIVSKLEASGYKAYIVGGCVRDAIMGREPKDYDVTTDARPEETTAVFSIDKVIDTGSKHGTVTVIHDGAHVEVTTFRKDSSYSDGRHPDSVTFSDNIEEDLARRDFTINAMAYNDADGLIDPFGGCEDIEKKIIRTVGEAEERFNEDSLRMLRALRFASELGFEIEEKTKAAIIEREQDIEERVSKERIQKELEGILTGDYVEGVLREYHDVIGVVIPEVLPMVGFDQKTPYHIYDVWEHTIRVVSGSPANPVSRFSALFHDIGKPPSFIQGEDGVGHFFGHPEVSYEMAERIMRRLRFDNATREDVLTIVRWHDLRPEFNEKSMRRTIMKVTPDLFDKWVAITRADNRAQSPTVADRMDKIAAIEEMGHRLIEEEGALSLKTLNIKGGDIIALGISEGPKVGEIMKELLEEVLEEKIPNEHEALMERAKEISNSFR
ncbi:MAG: HD domain-containing protein [Firmicutes bacterium]|nr:HD domain-containing protein [Bacillota bacterium]